MVYCFTSIRSSGSSTRRFLLPCLPRSTLLQADRAGDFASCISHLPNARHTYYKLHSCPCHCSMQPGCFVTFPPLFFLLSGSMQEISCPTAVHGTVLHQFTSFLGLNSFPTMQYELSSFTRTDTSLFLVLILCRVCVLPLVIRLHAKPIHVSLRKRRAGIFNSRLSRVELISLTRSQKPDNSLRSPSTPRLRRGSG